MGEVQVKNLDWRVNNIISTLYEATSATLSCAYTATRGQVLQFLQMKHTLNNTFFLYMGNS